MRAGLGPSLAFRKHVLPRLGDADIVEVQWPSMLGIVPTVRAATTAPITYLTHDVRSEALASLAVSRPFDKANAVAGLKLARVAAQELRALRAADYVLCCRESERNALRRLGVRRVEVHLPPFAPGPARPDRVSSGPLVLGFVADMTRIENVRSVHWFLSAVWPAVRQAHQDGVELHIFGRHDEVVEVPGVRWHGWIDDLAGAYARMDVAVAPLRIRGGIKVKVGEALSHGVPVIGSSIAVDGYPELIRDVVATADSPAEWVAATRSLAATRPAPDVLQKAMREAFDFAAVAHRHFDVYEDLVAARG